MIEVWNKAVKIDGRFLKVARLDGDKYTFPDDPQATIAGLRQSGKRIDLFTFLQKLPEKSPKYPYPYEWDNLAVLPITSFDYWWSHQIRSIARNRARQAEKRGVIFREVPFGEELLQGICDIYNETPVRLGKKFPHYGMTMERARQYAGTFLDRSTYIGAFVDEKMIGFMKLVADESRTQACIVHILSLMKHKDKAATNALIAQAVKACADRGISYLVYESFSYGKKQNDSLSHFKEVNGFQKFDLPRYYVPLTAVGQLAFRLGLHHRFADRLPEPLTTKFREVRKSWYERKYSVAVER